MSNGSDLALAVNTVLEEKMAKSLTEQSTGLRDNAWESSPGPAPDCLEGFRQVSFPLEASVYHLQNGEPEFHDLQGPWASHLSGSQVTPFRT